MAAATQSVVIHVNHSLHPIDPEFGPLTKPLGAFIAMQSVAMQVSERARQWFSSVRAVPLANPDKWEEVTVAWREPTAALIGGSVGAAKAELDKLFTKISVEFRKSSQSKGEETALMTRNDRIASAVGRWPSCAVPVGQRSFMSSFMKEKFQPEWEKLIPFFSLSPSSKKQKKPISVEVLAQDAYFGYQVLPFTLAENMGLHSVDWTDYPKLMKMVSDHGPIVVGGAFGRDYYTENPTSYPIVPGGLTWSEKKRRQIQESPQAIDGVVVVIVGGCTVDKTDCVLFRDPSHPDEEYVMKYQSFMRHLTPFPFFDRETTALLADAGMPKGFQRVPSTDCIE